MVTIISEQHDVNRINVEIPDFEKNLREGIARINSGGWDAAEYGISREAAVARLQAANTPEARETVIQDLIQRAIRRANLDTTKGRVAVMVAGQAAWHRLGVNVSEAVNGKEMLTLAGLDFTVEGWKVEAVGPNGERVAIPDRVANIRTDVNGYLGTVGTWYTPFQQEQLAEFADAISATGEVKWETAGAVKGGRRVWMLGRMDSMVEIVPGDEVTGYALFENSHDGTGALHILPTTVRSVCSNTLNLAMREGQGKILNILHSKNLAAKVEVARAHLGIVRRNLDLFEEEAKMLAKLKLNGQTVKDYFESFFPTKVRPAKGELPANTDGGALLDSILAGQDGSRAVVSDLLAGHYADTERIAARNQKVLDQLLENFESGKNRLQGMEGSAWGAVNSITEFVDWQSGRGEEARLQSAAFGAGSELKERAFQAAMALAR